ncbi:MAG: hypothetical protein SVR08_13355 [Spirochaetota bacterium]|nr:hypothetical protein [Spirochaetota bacterium]
MYRELLGEMEINISYELSYREGLKNTIRSKIKSQDDISFQPYWGAIIEKGCNKIKKGG